jgi:hypothetical protein
MVPVPTREIRIRSNLFKEPISFYISVVIYFESEKEIELTFYHTRNIEGRYSLGTIAICSEKPHLPVIAMATRL